MADGGPPDVPDSAAGGIVRRVTEHGTQVAVVRHPERRSDWTLPKGHRRLTDGRVESWEEAAAREVREETGFPATIRGTGSSGEPIAYEVDGASKVVLFFDMDVDADAEPVAREANVDVEWLTPPAALARLTHEAERDLLRRRFELGSRRRQSGWRWLSGRSQVRAERLRRALKLFEREFRHMVARAESDGRLDTENRWWVTATHDMLALSREAFEQGDIDTGWEALHGAQRFRLYGFDDVRLDEERAATLREGEAKLHGWRRDTVRALLTTDIPRGSSRGRSAGAAERSAREARLFQAQEILHGHFTNMYVKLGIRARGLVIPTVFLLVALVAVVATSLLDSGPEGTVIADAERLWWVLLFGGLGTALSAATLAMNKDSGPTRIPEMMQSWLTPVLRMLVGITSAVVVVLILESGLQSTVEVSGVGLYVMAVAAGFTERLVPRMLRSLETGAT